VPVPDALRGLIVQSGNDAAIAFAEAIAGNELAFSELMNQRARELGLRHSIFRNSSGLHHPEQVASVRDLAALAVHIIRSYPEEYKIFAEREFTWNKIRQQNRNPMLAMSLGVDGLKTGFIKESGYGIVVSAVNGGQRLIVAINGARTEKERADDARRLLEWGFRNYSEAKLFDPGQVVGHARIWGGERMYMPLVGGDGVSVVLPKFPANPKVSARIFYKGPLKPPLKKGEQVATLRVTTANDATSEVPLYAAEDVERAGFVRRGLDSLLYLATRWIP
jgi:D-alanyl-D-alanine carboxypeptidase (penicillin-binding protein 5/6)